MEKKITALAFGLCFVIALFAASYAQTIGPPPSGGGGAGNPCTTTASSLQYDAAGSFGCVAGWTSDGTNLTAALGTITSNVKALNITGTWNNSGVTFDAPLFMNITDTASNAASVLMDLQVSGNSVFRILKGDEVAPPNTFTIAPGNQTTLGAGNELILAPTGRLTLGGGNYVNVNTDFMAFNAAVYWGRFGSGNIGFNNNTTPVTLQVYNTSDVFHGTPTNYERGVLDWTTTTNTLTIGTQNGGTGTLRPLSLVGSTIALTGVANAGTTSALCYNTGTGVVTYDGTIGTCTTSTMRVKHDIRPLDNEALLDGVMRMRPVSFEYNAEMNTPGKQLGLVAEDVAHVDPDLVAYDDEGKPIAIKYLGPMMSYLVGAIKAQQVEIEQLKARLH